MLGACFRNSGKLALIVHGFHARLWHTHIMCCRAWCKCVNIFIGCCRIQGVILDFFQGVSKNRGKPIITAFYSKSHQVVQASDQRKMDVKRTKCIYSVYRVSINSDTDWAAICGQTAGVRKKSVFSFFFGHKKLYKNMLLYSIYRQPFSHSSLETNTHEILWHEFDQPFIWL